MNNLVSQLGDVVGTENVYVEADRDEKYGQDWTRFHTPLPAAVVFARSTEQLVRLVGVANRQGIGLVPSGGRTGLSAGAVAANGEVVVSFEKMNRILDFDEYDRSVTVEAGVITGQLQAFASDKGLWYPVDFASSGSSQMLKPDDWDVEDFKRECEQVSERVLDIVARFGGSISAEHGVGLLKRAQLHFSRSDEEITLMREVKKVFDPNNVMNPGKLIST